MNKDYIIYIFRNNPFKVAYRIWYSFAKEKGFYNSNIKLHENLDAKKIIKQFKLLDYKDLDFISSNCGGQLESIKKRVNFILENKELLIFNHRVNLNEENIWHKSFDTNKHWELKKWGEINLYGKNSAGDFKSTWELNRLQFLFDISFVFYVTNEEKYANLYLNILRDWIRNNPLGLGVNWVSNLEISIRVVSIMFSLPHILEGYRVDGKDLKAICNVLYYSMNHLKKNLNYSLIWMPNNHLVGDCVGLFFLCNLFQDSFCKKLLCKTERILKKQYELLFDAEGINKEGSLSYHRFTTQIYLLYYIYKVINIDLDSKILKEKIILPAKFIYELCGKDETTCFKYGDWDNGLFFNFGRENVDNFQTLKEILLALTYNKISSYFNIETKILLNKIINNRTNKILKIDVGSIVKKKFAGIYKVEINNKKLFVKCGKFGEHGHADQLSLVFKIDNSILFADSGTYKYNNIGGLRNYYRSQQAHNCIIFHNEKVAIPFKNFKWIKTVEGEIINIVKENSFVKISGKYKNKLSKKEYTRNIIFSNDLLIIKDIIEVEVNKKVGITLNYISEMDIIRKNNHFIFIDNEHILPVYFFVDNILYRDCEIKEVNISSMYNEMHKGTNLQLNYKIINNTNIIYTVISLNGENIKKEEILNNY